MTENVENIAEDLTNKLNIQENVVDLVLLTMVRLPDLMPPSFRSSYRPIAAAGTHEQRKQLAKLLATQLNEVDGNNLKTNVKQEPILNLGGKRNEMTEQDVSLNKNNKLQDVYQSNESSENNRQLLSRSNLPTMVRTSKTYKLADVTTLLNRKSLDTLLKNTFNRILTFEGLPFFLFIIFNFHSVIKLENQETFENKILKKNALFNFEFTKTGWNLKITSCL